MTQIKLSIAFVLAAAAIAPVFAQPLREGHEFAGDVDHRPYRQHHHHHHHQRVADQPSLDQPLKLKGKALEQHDRVLAKEGHFLADKDKVFEKEGKPVGHRPSAHPEPEILAREYAEFEDMFERADSEDVESGIRRSANTLLPHFKGPFHFGHGPAVVHRPHSGLFTSPRPLGRGPVDFRRPFNREPFIRPRPRLHFGPGPVVFRNGPPKREVVAREFAEFDDMVERDIEDSEFDARDFDELYLD